MLKAASKAKPPYVLDQRVSGGWARAIEAARASTEDTPIVVGRSHLMKFLRFISVPFHHSFLSARIMRYKGAIEPGLVQAEFISALNLLILKMFDMQPASVFRSGSGVYFTSRMVRTYQLTYPKL